MVEFSETAYTKEDHIFVKQDPGRIYRGLKDILVEEIGCDRVEEARDEFNVETPKDKIRLHAFKEKSPHTLIHIKINLRGKDPKHIYHQEHGDDIMKAKIDSKATVRSFYPGMDQAPWRPQPVSESPRRSILGGHLQAEEKTPFQRSRLYEILVSIWHYKIYGKMVERYEEEAEESVLRLHEILRNKFGVEKPIGKSPRSQYRPGWR